MKNALIILFVLAAVCPVLAQDVPEGPPPAVIAAHNQVVAFLQLTEEQVASWDEIYMIHREAELPVKEDMRQLEAELFELVNAEDPDPTVVGELVLEIADLREVLREIHLIYHEGFMLLLEEEQAGRLGFIARADKVQPVIPAFKLFELIPRR